MANEHAQAGDDWASGHFGVSDQESLFGVVDGIEDQGSCIEVFFSERCSVHFWEHADGSAVDHDVGLDAVAFFPRHRTSAEFFGQLAGGFEVSACERDSHTSLSQSPANSPSDAPGSEDQCRAAFEGIGFFVDFRQSVTDAFHGSAEIGVVTDAIFAAKDDGVAGSDTLGCRFGLGEHRQDGLFVGNRHAQAADTFALAPTDEGGDISGSDAEGQVTVVEIVGFEGAVVEHRAVGLRHGVGDNAEDFGFCGDRLDAVDIFHVVVGELAGSHTTVEVEDAVGEGSSVSGTEDTGDRAVVAHGDTDGGCFGVAHHFDDAGRIVERIGLDGDFDNIRIELGQPSVDRFEVVGDAFEVMVADDSFGFAVARDFRGGVFFEVDVFDSGGDRLSQEHQAVFFGLFPAASIFFSAAGHDHGGRPIFEDPGQIDAAGDVIHPEFDEFGPLGRHIEMFLDGVFMTGAGNGDAKHAVRRLVEKGLFGRWT